MPYGSGSIYLRGRLYWISYMVRGEQVNESSKSPARKDAEKLLRKRMGEIEAGRAVAGVGITVPDLLGRLETYYVDQGKRSLRDLKSKISSLKKRFPNRRAAEFGSDDIQRFKVSMKRVNATNATINRYLQVLRRAFTLAAQNDPPLVGRVPHFALLREDNARSGFITNEQYRALLFQLPDHLKGVLIFGYHLGMRKAALLSIRRDQVDRVGRVIRTEQIQGGKPIGRVLPIYGDMIGWLEMQMPTWGETPKCRWIFHQNGAGISGEFRKSWASACRRAGVSGLLFHDLRRSAVRNMELAGVPRSQAMAITGHRTEAIYKRYAIVAEQDIKAAGDKLGRQMAEPSAETKTVREMKQ